VCIAGKRKANHFPAPSRQSAAICTIGNLMLGLGEDVAPRFSLAHKGVAVAFLDPILHMPYAFIWLPGLVFLAIVGGVYWFSRPAQQLAPAEAAEPVIPVTLAPKAKDLRGAARRNGNTVEVHIAPLDQKDNPDIGSVLDRSMGGMRLALFNEVETGIVLAIRPVHADEMVPWIEIEIRSCKLSKEMPGLFEVGCQYVKSPPYSIQLLFG
jgi:hypothetical protein